MSSNSSLKEQRDYAWSYFQLHANQRMTSFNFFVVIAALLTTGLAGTLKSDFKHDYIGMILALSLPAISFIFWKIDRRVRYMIKNAETALKSIEEEWRRTERLSGPEVAIFQMEEEQTAKIKSMHSWNPWNWHLSYTNCFESLYLLFVVLGLAGCVATVIKWAT